jgi:hypothetical protein
MHFDLDSHDAYTTTQDDPTRMVPNPAKKRAHTKALAARARYDRALGGWCRTGVCGAGVIDSGGREWFNGWRSFSILLGSSGFGGLP